jgi:hypothetical protein
MHSSSHWVVDIIAQHSGGIDVIVSTIEYVVSHAAPVMLTSNGNPVTAPVLGEQKSLSPPLYIHGSHPKDALSRTCTDAIGYM